MGGTKADLETMFSKAVAAFNGGAATLGTLTQYLDDNVTIYGNTQHQPHSPRAAAVDYLKTQVLTDNPNFTLPNPIPAVINAKGTGGVIQGTTTWKDNNGKEDLLYSFTFVFKNGQWLFSSMWGA